MAVLHEVNSVLKQTMDKHQKIMPLSHAVFIGGTESISSCPAACRSWVSREVLRSALTHWQVWTFKLKEAAILIVLFAFCSSHSSLKFQGYATLLLFFPAKIFSRVYCLLSKCTRLLGKAHRELVEKMNQILPGSCVQRVRSGCCGVPTPLGPQSLPPSSCQRASCQC